MPSPLESRPTQRGERHSDELIDRYERSIGGTPNVKALGPYLLAPFRRRLIATDICMVAVAVGAGLLVSSRASQWHIDPTLAIYGVPVAIVLMWVSFLGLRGSFDQRVIGVGTGEVRLIVSATLLTFAVVAGISYLIRADVSRAYAFISLPLGLVLIVSGRLAWRRWLYARRQRGEFQHRTVVVGRGPSQSEIVASFEGAAYAGYKVVGTYGTPLGGIEHVNEWLDGLDFVIRESHADAVAIAPSETLTGEVVREISWRIEGRRVDLLIAPAMLNVGGSRLSVRPAAGLPLLHLDEVALTRPQRFVKRSLDIALGTTLALLLSPVLAICAVAVRLSSRGPVVFRQTRIGRGGEPFTMFKFRTMVKEADSERERLRAANGLVQPMFKLLGDPRVTCVGRSLRRWSLDELPQLFNVIGGSMSLVGPRPHPLDDVNRYDIRAYRRLALKPGMTGLWQVEGRSDLAWQEALQLDLYYVESWSLSGDLVLLGRTIRAVIQGRGAV